MGLDTSERASVEALFNGTYSFPLHRFHETRATALRAGKQRMYNKIMQMVRSVPGKYPLRFMSLPGMEWRVEHRMFKDIPRRIYHTGFERESQVMTRGVPFVPRSTASTQVTQWCKVHLDALPGIEYFKTNRARWIHLDVNDALTLTPAYFQANPVISQIDAYQWWLKKFCLWDSVWLDYFGPASDKMAKALNNLHWHCNPELDEIPVALTILKGREQVHTNSTMVGLLSTGGSGTTSLDRRTWMEHNLGGGDVFRNITFQTQEYFEYNDSGSTMCNIIGKIIR